MFERPKFEKKESRNNYGNLMRAAAFIVAISPIEGKAEEIPEINGVDWYQGVEILKQSATSAKHEVGAMYLKIENGSGEWISQGHAEGERSVIYHKDKMRKDLTKFEDDHNEIIETCHVHTHPLSILLPTEIPQEEIEKMYANGDYLVPPSLDDIVGAADHKDEEMAGKPTISSVFTPMGVWYYRPATPEDYSSEYPTAESYFRESQAAMEQLLGNDGQSGVLNDYISTIGVTAFGEQHNINFESKEGLTPEQATSLIGTGLKNARSLNDPMVERIRAINDEFNSLVIEAVKLKAFGSYLYTYSYFHSAYNNVSTKYDEDISGMFDRDISEFRKGIPEYNQLKSVRAGADAVSLADNLEGNLIEDMLMVGVVGRYVPYDQLSSEPPCAGPDYKNEVESK